MQRPEINEFYEHFHVTRDPPELRDLVQLADLIVRSAQLHRESRRLHFVLEYKDEIGLWRLSGVG